MPGGFDGGDAPEPVAGRVARRLFFGDAQGFPAKRIVLSGPDPHSQNLHHLSAAAGRMAQARSEFGQPRASGAGGSRRSGAHRMNPSRATLNPEEMQVLVEATLRELHGAEAWLEDWAARPVSKRGK